MSAFGAIPSPVICEAAFSWESSGASPARLAASSASPGIWFLIVGAALCQLLFAPVSVRAQSDYCAIAKTAIKDASRIRKLEVKKQVPCLVHDRGDVKNYLLETISTKLPRGKLAMEEFVYRALGMIPPEFDYQSGIVDLYMNQIGGYYDPEKDHFVMAGWMPALLQTTVAIHELTHGLQDQHFNLEELINPHSDNGDSQLARSALVEGDANRVMLDYARKLAGQPALEQEANVDSFVLQNIIGMSLMSGLGNVPESLQMSLLFPYTSGLRFVHFLMRRGGSAAVDRAFRAPPRSTEEILHPEKYLNSSPDFRTIDDSELRQPAVPEAATIVYRDTMGEFAISALLGNFTLDKAISTAAAAGWAGDRVAVFELGLKRWVVWKVLWDSENDTREFFEAYSAALGKTYGQMRDDSWYDSNGRQFTLTRHAKGVLLIVSSPASSGGEQPAGSDS